MTAAVRRFLRRAAGPLMALPAVALLLVFVALPFVLAVALSLTDLRLGSPLPVRFVGLQQYARVLGDPVFARAALNNLVFAAMVVPVQTGLALGLALLLNREMRGRALLRTLVFMPVVFPMALIAVVWQLLYAPGGMVETVLFFWRDAPVDVLHDPRLALPAIMALSVWQGVGFQMVVLLAGLQAIPESLYEAARIDRADAWARFRHVTLPQLRNPLVFTALVTTILALRVFDQVRILTRGGPLDSTTTVIHQAVITVFARLQVGQACAMIVLFFLAVLAVTLVQRRLVRQERELG